nr:MAG TPA: hypothetical protein [Caudoviricetes sp.]
MSRSATSADCKHEELIIHRCRSAPICALGDFFDAQLHYI